MYLYSMSLYERWGDGNWATPGPHPTERWELDPVFTGLAEENMPY